VAYKDKIEDFKKAASLVTSIPKAPRPSLGADVPTCAVPSVPQIPAEFTKQPTIKPLSSFLDISKTRNLPPKEIEAIWRLRHASSTQSLCATIPVNIYNEMEATARKHPFFILPLPKEGQGAEIHFLQWIFPTPNTVTVLFTQLAEYKLRGEFSQPHTTITHHLDLAEPTGLVLMQGQVLKGRGITIEEAKWLVMCLQKFYGTDGAKSKRRNLLELFGRGEKGFKLEELIDEAEKLL
jgi:ATP synthase mitochondrial F1 complex assembly factor 1